MRALYNANKDSFATVSYLSAISLRFVARQHQNICVMLRISHAVVSSRLIVGALSLFPLRVGVYKPIRGWL